MWIPPSGHIDQPSILRNLKSHSCGADLSSSRLDNVCAKRLPPRHRQPRLGAARNTSWVCRTPARRCSQALPPRGTHRTRRRTSARPRSRLRSPGRPPRDALHCVWRGHSARHRRIPGPIRLQAGSQGDALGHVPATRSAWLRARAAAGRGRARSCSWPGGAHPACRGRRQCRRPSSLMPPWGSRSTASRCIRSRSRAAISTRC